MPLYANHFSGHFESGDPRGPLTAAVGCTWPTVPPHRWHLWSGNATGEWTFLNNGGVLLEKVTAGPAHEFCSWGVISGPPTLWFATLQKDRANDPNGYRWYFTAGLFSGCAIDKLWEEPYQACNVDVPIGNLECEFSGGNTGSGFTARQVVWDETLPQVWPLP